MRSSYFRSLIGVLITIFCMQPPSSLAGKAGKAPRKLPPSIIIPDFSFKATVSTINKARNLVSNAFTSCKPTTTFEYSAFPETSWLSSYPRVDTNGLSTLMLDKKKPQIKPKLDEKADSRKNWTLGTVPSLIIDKHNESRLSGLIINKKPTTTIIAITTKRDELNTIGKIIYPTSDSYKPLTNPALEILDLIYGKITDEENHPIALEHIKSIIIYFMKDEVIIIRYFDSNSPPRLAYEVTVDSQTQEISFYKSDIEFPRHPPTKKTEELEIIMILDEPYREPKPRETKTTKAAKKKLQTAKADFCSDNPPAWYKRDQTPTGCSLKKVTQLRRKKQSVKPDSHSSNTAPRIKPHPVLYTNSDDEEAPIVRKKRQPIKSVFPSRKTNLKKRMRWRRFLDTDSDNDGLPIVKDNQPSTSGVLLPISTSHVIMGVDGYKTYASLIPELEQQEPDNISTSPGASPDDNDNDNDYDYDYDYDYDDNRNGFSLELIPEIPLPAETVNILNTPGTPSVLYDSQSSFVLRLESSENSLSQETSDSGSKLSESTEHSYDLFRSQPAPIDCTDENSESLSIQQAQSPSWYITHSPPKLK